MIYRREIDGLRAVAVLPVILFHGGFQAFSGGFIGVDVFFVISGYLITSILLGEIRARSFSIAKFYERRARRILPALFVVMLGCLPFAWLWLLPADMKDFAKSLIGTSAFISNIVFWRQTGYFDGGADLKPLLHTWSLAVEEQYYVLFPMLLAVTMKLKERWVSAVIGGLLMASLALAQWGCVYIPSSTYYLLPMRGWELLVGSLVAFFGPAEVRSWFGTSKAGAAAIEALSLAGMALIVLGIVALNERTPFPGFYALIPTVGTALIILFSSQQTIVGRVLGNSVLVGIGLISYSAYLWHQPIFAFAKYRGGDDPSVVLQFALTGLALGLAYLTWKFVETPFRDRKKVSRRAIIVSSVCVGSGFIALGAAGLLSGGFDQRTASDGVRLADIQQKVRINPGLGRDCDGALPPAPACRTSDAPQILVWGDSFGMHLIPGILSEHPNAKLIQLTSSSCGPIFNVSAVAPTLGVLPAKKCVAFTRAVDAWLSRQTSVRYVVVSSPFVQYFAPGNRLMVGDDIVEQDPDLVLREFRKTLQSIAARGAIPIVVSPPPTNGSNLGRCLANSLEFGKPLERCDFRESDLHPEQVRVYAFLRQIQSEYRVVWLDQAICPDAICHVYDKLTFLYRDSDHLSVEGSALLGRKFSFLAGLPLGTP